LKQDLLKTSQSSIEAVDVRALAFSFNRLECFACLWQNEHGGPKYITADIVVGLVLSLFLLLLLSCFMGFLGGIETPLRFPRKTFDVSKEY
jgi:hypothetical protein